MTAGAGPLIRPSEVMSQARLLRNSFGAYATGVAVIGAKARDGELVGMTVSSFVPISLDPPLIAFAPAKSIKMLDAYIYADFFSVSVLGEEQALQSSHFASVGSGKWNTVIHELSVNGSPALPGAKAIFECKKYSQLEMGDHMMIFGEVISHRTTSIAPLLFSEGKYRGLKEFERPFGTPELPSQIGWSI